MLAEMGVEVNMPDTKGNTPLIVAVKNQKETSIKFLISLGAKVNLANDDGHTPLHVAVQVKNLRICKDLCLKGADRSAKDKVSFTPESLAKMILFNEPNYKSFIQVLAK